MSMGRRMRTLLREKQYVYTPGITHALHAMIVEKTGFDYVYMGGYDVSLTLFGLPDVGLLTATEMVENARHIARSVRIPVIAAGGIADAQGIAAAMALGASAVQIGTAYLLCPEATTGAVHRAALRSHAARVTAITNVFTGRPARGIVNRIVRELGPISPAAPAFPLATAAIAPLRAKAEAQGSGDFSPLWAGQNVSGCKEIPAAALTRELAQAFSR